MSSSRRRPRPPQQHLITVFDVTRSGWAAQALEKDRGLTLQSASVAVIAFLRAFLLQDRSNGLSFITVDEKGSDYLYPPRRFSCTLDKRQAGSGIGQDSTKGGGEPARATSASLDRKPPVLLQDSIIWESLCKLVQEHERNNSGTRAASSSSSDENTDEPPTCRGMATALSCAVGKSRALLQKNPNLEVRVLVVLASGDYKPYYIPLMNTIFAAESLRVCIDCINVHAVSSKLMQQACNQTKGTYQHLNGEQMRDRAGILEEMLFHFLPSRSLRETLRASVSVEDVDLRASCFNNGVECEKGSVCSVCLSIFRWEYRTAVCDTCKTEFSANKRAKAKRPPKKRKRVATKNVNVDGSGKAKPYKRVKTEASN